MFVSPDNCLPWLLFQTCTSCTHRLGWDGCIGVVIYVLSPLIIVSPDYYFRSVPDVHIGWDGMVVLELWFMFCLPWLLFQICTRCTQRLGMEWLYWSCDVCLFPLILVSPDYYFRSVIDVHRGWGWNGCIGVVVYVCLPWLLSPPDYCLPWLFFQICTRCTQRLRNGWLF